MKYTEKYVPDGIDLIGSIILLAPIARLIATGLTPVVNNTLIKIGDIIQSSIDTNPLIMGIVLGGIITVVVYCSIKFNGSHCIAWFNGAYGHRSAMVPRL